MKRTQVYKYANQVVIWYKVTLKSDTYGLFMDMLVNIKSYYR